jgi:hypothetical protein
MVDSTRLRWVRTSRRPGGVFWGSIQAGQPRVGFSSYWLYRAGRTGDEINLGDRNKETRGDNQDVPRGKGEENFPCELRARWRNGPKGIQGTFDTMAFNRSGTCLVRVLGSLILAESH